MSLLSPTLPGLTPAAFWRWGRLLLGAGLALGLLLVGYLTWAAPGLLPFFPLVLLGGVVMWYLFRHPLLHLSVVLIGFVAIASSEEGLQLREIVYGLYLYAMLAHWFVTRLFLYKERILWAAEDKAMLLFLMLLPCTVLLTMLFGGDLGAMTRETLALMLLALYFPVREACLRYRHGVKAMLLVVGCVGVGVALRNVLHYQEMLLQATQIWQVEKGRVATNDNLLMVSSLFGLTLLIFARRWWSFVLLLVFFLVVFSGLILTQSRGYWVAFLLGALVMFVLAEAPYRKRMLWLALLGTVALAGIGFAFFGQYMTLLVSGLQSRFTSLGTATTADVSLVNRLRETQVVWSHVVKNPVLGYGMGVPYPFFDITRHSTDLDDFVHNGYFGLWYKFGLWGLGLVLFFWARTAWRGVQAFARKTASPYLRVCGLAAALSLIAFTLSTITSNPFYLKDSLFIFSLCSGMAAGAYWRGRAEAQQHATR